MSQVRVLSVAIDTAVRKEDDGSNGQGCGQSKHIYVGRYGSAGSPRNYTTYIQFALDWSGVAKIVSATLNLYSDEFDDPFAPAGEPGIMASPSATDSPTITIRRLTAPFTEGNNVDGHFDSSDYVNPSSTTSGAVSKVMRKGADLLNTIDITNIVKAWAPSTVSGGGRATNYGIALIGSTDPVKNFSGWSAEHTGGGGAAERPTITLTYELGPTVPNVPSNMTPAGNVAVVDSFQGDFSDVRPTDYLSSVAVEIYGADVSGTASAATDQITVPTWPGRITPGDVIYFTSLTGGVGLSLLTPYYIKAVAANKTTGATVFTVSTSNGGATTNITTNYTALKWAVLSQSIVHSASEGERNADHFNVPKPDKFVPFRGATYHWRARYVDQEGQLSAWSTMVAFTPTNNPPDAPTLTPASGTTVVDLIHQPFSGTFHDPDTGDVLQAHQVQLSPFPQSDVRWDEGDGILWDTGKVFALLGDTSWTSLYGGPALLAGTYYWRARVYDQYGAPSSWSYAQIILTTDFNPDPTTQPLDTPVQIDPHAPWRIKIKGLGTSRGPGLLLAVFEEAKNVGASVVYNSPGELHFTLLKDDPQLSVVEPRQTHYALEFYAGNGWVEKFAGVIWDVDATENDVVIKGIDYLALFDTIVDERYDPLKPNKSYTAGGSFYSNVSISTVVSDQLTRAHGLTDSWVGFISIGSIATMNEKVTVYSTMQSTLSFIAGLIDSHRQGTGKRTRMKVVKTTAGGYQVQIVDDPGQIRNDLGLYYGELVQGYRVIVFGDGWANVQHVVGRNREGSKVVYETISGKPFQPSTSIYGRVATVAVMDGVQDQNDLARRGLQAAIHSAKLGKNIALGLRVQNLAPLAGWDITDVFPVKIDDGGINTDNFGSGFWAAYAYAWEATDIGEQSGIITFMPREDATAPNPDLIPSRPISPQSEWQIGWHPPDPLTSDRTLRLSLDTGFIMDDARFMDDAYAASSSIYVDMTTGLTYELQGDDWVLVSGQPTLLPPASLDVDSVKILTTAGVTVTNVNVKVIR